MEALSEREREWNEYGEFSVFLRSKETHERNFLHTLIFFSIWRDKREYVMKKVKYERK